MAGTILSAPVTAALIAIDIFVTTIRETRVIHPVACVTAAVARARAISRIAGIAVANGSSCGACGGILRCGTDVMTGIVCTAPVAASPVAVRGLATGRIADIALTGETRGAVTATPAISYNAASSGKSADISRGTIIVLCADVVAGVV